MADNAPERVWVDVPRMEVFTLPSTTKATYVEYVRAPSPDSINLHPLEFWCDLAEVLGHPRPAKVNPATMVAEVNERLSPDSVREKAERAVEALDAAGYLDEMFIAEMADNVGSDRQEFFQTCKRTMADIIVAEFGSDDEK